MGKLGMLTVGDGEGRKLLPVVRGERRWAVRTGDVSASLRRLPDGCVHCCVTSPPYYGLRSYLPKGHSDKAKELGAEKTPAEYVARMVGVFREVRRVLHPSGTLWLNLGDSYSSGGNGPGSGKQLTNMGSHLPARTCPDGFKPKDLLGIPWRTAFALQEDGWFLRSACPWVKRNCLSGGAWVYARTKKGEMPVMVKDLVRLKPSTVQLWDGGKWTQVVDWWRNESAESGLELVLRSGERVGCTADHLWPTQRGNVRADQLAAGDVIQTCVLPAPPGEDPPYLTAEAAWFVGVFLAEGSRSEDTIQIAANADELHWVPRLEAVARHYGGSVAHTVSGQQLDIRMYGRVLDAILHTYVGGLTARDKHLKVAAWRLSNPMLRSVIQGYLDGDAHHDEPNSRYRLGFARNYHLERDLRVAAARLGAVLTLNPSQAEGFGKVQPTFKGEWRWARSSASWAKDRGEVMEIRNSRARQFWDIAVADDPHLFALASGVLTHNCMPESVTDRPATACEYVFLLAKSPTYFFDMEAVKRSSTGQAGAAADFRRATKEPAVPGQLVKQHRTDREPTADDGTRNFRNGDLWFESVGMLLAGESPDDAELLGFDVTLRPFKGAHFAVMPRALVEPCVRAGTSERGVCPGCGEPWRRVVEKDRRPTRPGVNTKVTARGAASPVAGTSGEYSGDGRAQFRRSSAEAGNRDPQRHCTTTKTAGWEPGCGCEDDTPVPALVLDPFSGAGTVGLVAASLGRRYVGCELFEDFAQMGRERIRKVVSPQM